MEKKIISKRRNFIRSTGLAGTSILLPREVTAVLSKIKSPIKLGLIADLHQDMMHDGPARLKAFLDAMTVEKPDALLQLGDFAYPLEEKYGCDRGLCKGPPQGLACAWQPRDRWRAFFRSGRPALGNEGTLLHREHQRPRPDRSRCQ